MSAEVLKTKQDWAKWILVEEEKNKKVYTTQPDRLIADFHQEREARNGYAGREFLELLQNAADAASDANILGKVRIEIRPDFAVVANTGKPFDTGGVKSLLTANLSPKVDRQNKNRGGQSKNS